jgi:hypothetical protein
MTKWKKGGGHVGDVNFVMNTNSMHKSESKKENTKGTTGQLFSKEKLNKGKLKDLKYKEMPSQKLTTGCYSLEHPFFPSPITNKTKNIAPMADDAADVPEMIAQGQHGLKSSFSSSDSMNSDEEF